MYPLHQDMSKVTTPVGMPANRLAAGPTGSEAATPLIPVRTAPYLYPTCRPLSIGRQRRRRIAVLRNSRANLRQISQIVVVSDAIFTTEQKLLAEGDESFHADDAGIDLYRVETDIEISPAV